MNVWGTPRWQPKAVDLFELVVLSPNITKGQFLCLTPPPPLPVCFYSPCVTPTRKICLFFSWPGAAWLHGPHCVAGEGAEGHPVGDGAGAPPFPRTRQIWAAIWHCFPSALFSRLLSCDSQCFLSRLSPALLSHHELL